MPDTKFTWPNLKEHLRKYLWIYLAGIVACLFCSNLLWTTTRPRPTNDESVIVYLVGGYGSADALREISADMLARGQQQDARLKQVEFQHLQYEGTDSDYTGSVLLLTRLAVGEGDAYIASEAGLEALLNAGAVQPLDDLAPDWLSEYGLEPCHAEMEDEETEERLSRLAGFKLDGVTALGRLGAFDNRGATLCLSATSENPETTMAVLETMLEDLTNAGTENQ